MRLRLQPATRSARGSPLKTIAGLPPGPQPEIPKFTADYTPSRDPVQIIVTHGPAPFPGVDETIHTEAPRQLWLDTQEGLREKLQARVTVLAHARNVEKLSPAVLLTAWEKRAPEPHRVSPVVSVGELQSEWLSVLKWS